MPGSQHRKRKTVSVFLLSAMAALASCGGSKPTVSAPAPQNDVAPGYDSPQSAVAGYLSGWVRKDTATICSYVAPPQKGYCAYLVGGPTKYSLASWRIGDAMIRGDEAIVVIMSDSWCVAKFCFKNTDPRNGLPSTSAGFAHAFEKTSTGVPAVAVVRVHAKWYVALA